jgi:hypothetical protein
MRQQMGLRDEQKKMRECSLARGDRESVASSLSTPARDATPGYDRAHASNGGRGRLRPPAWCGRQAFQGHPHEYQVLGAWRREGIRLRWFFAVLLGSSWVCFTCPAGAWRNSLSYCTGIASGPCWCMSVCNRTTHCLRSSLASTSANTSSTSGCSCHGCWARDFFGFAIASPPCHARPEAVP